MSSQAPLSAVAHVDDPDSRLLVPLDGSERAACALPVATHVAQAVHAPLLLARITPYLGVPAAAAGVPLPADTYQQLIDDERRMASDYLDKQAEPLRQQGLAVQTFVAHGDPAAILLELAGERHVSLIVMTTHGRTGFARFALGSVADRLVHYGHLPILLLRSMGSGGDQRQRSPAALLDRALVPLDGSALAEAALDCVLELAGTLVHRITLLCVVLPTAKRSERLEAAEYLERRYQAFRNVLAGRECVLDTLLLEGTMVGEKIAQQSEEESSLVVMATHGRTGITRWALGSVAAQVVHASQIPVLLVHPAPVAPASEQPTSTPETVLGASSLPRTAPLREMAIRTPPEEAGRA